ncbi:hypothetical protein BJ878DRAFT_26684 [Calycina marina]|uniref:Coupling of ubiquitin conjugation to ER degradation protein 1 n=1 Tax=Calycina marina TaxID=1763456 RepID=A0A9P7ZB76_9HELO|nr:hypothetical protein BJ878DRAFT_26684 [Calycina marina]
MADEQTINLPQLVIVIVLAGLAVRYLFFGTATGNSTPSSRTANNVGAREADVEHILQIWPQADRRSIMWDLQRNGGNLAATTERMLSGRGLEVPPQSFQPPLPVAVNSTAPTASTNSGVAQTPDLITRYNLKAKVAEQEAEKATEEETETEKKKKGQAWSQNKVERQALLQRRREEMILKARRHMESKVAEDT